MRLFAKGPDGKLGLHARASDGVRFDRSAGRQPRRSDGSVPFGVRGILRERSRKMSRIGDLGRPARLWLPVQGVLAARLGRRVKGRGSRLSGLCLRHSVGLDPRGREGSGLRVESGSPARGPSWFASPSRRASARDPACRARRASERQAGVPYECRLRFPLEHQSEVGFVLYQATLQHPDCGPRANGPGVGCERSFNALVSGGPHGLREASGRASSRARRRSEGFCTRRLSH